MAWNRPPPTRWQKRWQLDRNGIDVTGTVIDVDPRKYGRYGYGGYTYPDYEGPA